MQALVLFIGRLMISVVFLMSAVYQLIDWDSFIPILASKNVPMIPMFLTLSFLLQLFGGLALVFGNKSRLGAILLIIFLIPATAVLHDFWNLNSPDWKVEFITFSRNLAILGGLFYVMIFGSGQSEYEDYYDEDEDELDFLEDENF